MMNNVFNYFARPSRFLKPGRSLLLILFLCFCTAAFAAPTTPTSDFIDNQDGTVTHKTTGLIWQRCALGQTWTGTTCSGTAGTYTYDAAVALKRSFAGHSDWRLPNIAELHTIVERENVDPAINTDMFPNTPNAWYWSSSPVASNSGYAWIVGFGNGYGAWDSKNGNYYVRLVRSGQSFGVLPLTTPTSDFTDNKDGTVTHKRTGLIWQRCSVGQTWTGSSCSGTASPYTYDAALALTSTFAGHSDWRVPNANELLSIVEYGAYNPAINQTLFPNTPNAWYWSSSPVANYSDFAWIVDFYGGYDDWDGKDGNGYVRLVRSGQSVGVLPNNVVLLLHGMNAIPTTPDDATPKGTWNDFATQYFNANCPSIINGKITATAKPNAQNTYCYAVKFGSLDAYNATHPNSPSYNKGLGDAWDYGESNNHASAGDYSSFEQLGSEIDKAITSIRKKRPDARILLIGHSRGGLAARAFLQQPASSKNKNSVVGLVTTGTPHKGTRMGRIYRYIQNVLLDANGKRVTGVSWINDDWQAIDFLRGTRSCNGTGLFKDFRLDALRPVIGYLSDASRMIKALNDNQGNLPLIKYGEIVYSGEYLGKLQADPLYNLFDESGADFCDQVSTHAEAFIKGGTSDAPTPSTDYPGDGIVTAGSQGATVLPKGIKHVYRNWGVLHTEEPEQTAHIANMACLRGFSWLDGCASTAQSTITKQAQAPFKPIEIISDDYDALVALSVDALWQDWLAIITDDTQANQRDQYAVALGIKLRASDDAAFYADVTQRLLNTNAPQLERARLAKLLAEIATPSALEILTNALLNPECSAMQTALSNAILTTADSLPEQPRRADLSAVLETAWTLPKQNQQQHHTLALALAKLGTPRGVELLLAAVRDLPSAKKKTLSYAEQQAKAAFIAMDEIINPDSVTVLSHAFTSHRASEAVFIAAGNGLVNLGRDDAAQRVLQRINELPDAAVPVGQQWLGRLSGKIDKAALRSINKTLGLPRQPQLRQQMQDMVQ